MIQVKVFCDRRRDGHTDIQTDKQIDRHTDRQTGELVVMSPAVAQAQG